MSASFQFVHVSSAADGQHGAHSVVDRRAIRSQAMRDYRRRQREAATTSFQTSSQIATSAPIRYSAQVLDRLNAGNQILEQEGTSISAVKSVSLAQDHSEPVQLLFQGSRSKPLTLFCTVASGVPQGPEKHPGCTDKRCQDCLRIRQSLVRRMLPVPVPNTLRSPAMIREPMLQIYIEAFYPSCIWSNPQMTGTLSDWSIPRSQATLHINETVGLTHLGFTRQDKQLAMEGRKRHIVAAGSLRRELDDTSIPIEITSSAVLSMMAAEIYSATYSGLTGCATHLAGVTAILHAHLSRPNARPVNKQVMRHYQRLILVQGLLHRKALSLGEQLTTREDAPTPGSIEALIQLGLNVPGLVEAADTYLNVRRHRKDSDSEYTDSLDLALGLRLKLDDWLRDYESGGFRYRKDPLEFRTPVDGNVLGLYWSLQLLLAECVFNLYTSDSSTASTKQVMQSAKNEADMYASLLVETATVLNGVDSAILSKATGMRAPLHFAKQWYIRTGEKRRVHTIEVIEHQLQADLPGIEWISLLYWSFMAASWLERI